MRMLNQFDANIGIGVVVVDTLAVDIVVDTLAIDIVIDVKWIKLAVTD